MKERFKNAFRTRRLWTSLGVIGGAVASQQIDIGAVQALSDILSVFIGG